MTENADKILVPMEDVKKAKEMIQRLKDCGLYDKRFAGGKYQVEFNVDLDGVLSRGSWIVFRRLYHRLKVFSLDQQVQVRRQQL